MTKKLKKELLTIAHSYGVKCRFYKKYFIADADVFTKTIRICVDRNHTVNDVLSQFFHELGHIVDHKNGVYREYYKRFPTKKVLRRIAVKAELHTDYVGEKLMKQYYPDNSFVHTYKYKVWQKYLLSYWGI